MKAERAIGAATRARSLQIEAIALSCSLSRVIPDQVRDTPFSAKWYPLRRRAVISSMTKYQIRARVGSDDERNGGGRI
jgi:hypothetical protein